MKPLLTALFLSSLSLLAQPADCVFDVGFDPSVDTEIRILGQPGQALEIAGDTCANCFVTFAVDGVTEFLIASRIPGLTQIDQSYCYDDTVKIRLVPEDSDFKYALELESAGGDQFLELLNQFMEESGYVSPQIRTKDKAYMDSLRTHVVLPARDRAMATYARMFPAGGDAYASGILNIIYGMLYSPFSYTPEEVDELRRAVEAIRRPSLPLLLTRRKIDLRVGVANTRLHAGIRDGVTGGNFPAIRKALAENDYVLLNFWIESCGPCRQFNKEVASNYRKLRKRGIEVVNLNADYFTKEWRRASAADGMVGLNLHEGALSELLSYYNPEGRFPTKVLYTRDGKHLAGKIKTVEDLLKLAR